jgi:hypothetical protein
MRNLMPHIALIAALLVPLCATASDPWPDEVISVTYGPGAGFGQDHFPGNILGPPDSLASEQFPSQTPSDLLSLGSGGEIILRFDEPGILDGPGPDFTVFENAFSFNNGMSVFTETAFVAVSQDGLAWYEFTWDTDTLTGLAGLTPTNGAADPTDPSISGGDSFDLSDLNFESVYYVRLTDTDGTVLDGGTSFDLDAVVAIHNPTESPTADDPRPIAPALYAWPNPFNASVSFRVPLDSQRIHVFDALGRLVETVPVELGHAEWNADHRSSGTYVIRADGEASNPIRIVKVR